MIYECIDCENCANFYGGFRLFCLHPELPPEEILKYQPLGDDDAYNCSGFDDVGYQRLFTYRELREAESYSKERHGGVTYQGIRDWCNDRLISKSYI